MHLLHYNSKYDSVKSAMDKPNGLAALGVLFEVCFAMYLSLYIYVPLNS